MKRHTDGQDGSDGVHISISHTKDTRSPGCYGAVSFSGFRPRSYSHRKKNAAAGLVEKAVGGAAGVSENFGGSALLVAKRNRLARACSELIWVETVVSVEDVRVTLGLGDNVNKIY